MNSISAFAPRLALFVALMMVTITGTTRADVIDLSLNVYYSDVDDPNSGGTWQVAAKTDQFGLANVFFNLRNITIGGYVNLAPNGTVNGGDHAGFKVIPTGDQGGYVQFGLIQPALGLTEEAPFYGVGSIVDPEGATPNYTNQAAEHPNSTAIGPVLTTLTNLNNPVWGVDDPLSEMPSEWDPAAILVEGTFSPGQTPGFFTTDEIFARGNVFITLPADTSDIGELSDVFEATTVVRTNLNVPTADFGDYNEDGIVNMADYTVWRNNLGATVSPAGSGADGDQNGVVDVGDYNVWKSNFGLFATPIVSGPIHTAAVPEPQSLILLAFTAAGAHILGIRRLVSNK